MEFSFLKGNLMVPAVSHYLVYLPRMVRALDIVEGDEPGVLQTSPSSRCWSGYRLPRLRRKPQPKPKSVHTGLRPSKSVLWKPTRNMGPVAIRP